MPTTITGTSIDVPNRGLTTSSLPVGSVVQVKYTSSATRSSIAAGAFAEVNTNYRVAITPKSSTNVIVLRYYIPTSPYSGYQPYWVHRIRAFRMVGGTKAYNLTSSGANNGNRPGIAGINFRSSNGYDANDPTYVAFDALDVAGTTSEITYGFEAAPGGGTVYFGYSGNNDTWGFDTNILITAMEVAA